MTVAELMALLDGLPADAMVQVCEWDDHEAKNTLYNIAEVSVHHRGGQVAVTITSEGSAS